MGWSSGKGFVSYSMQVGAFDNYKRITAKKQGKTMFKKTDNLNCMSVFPLLSWFQRKMKKKLDDFEYLVKKIIS